MFRGELADRRILFHLIKSASASGARGEGKTDHRFLSAPKPVPSATQFSRRPAATLFCGEGSPTGPVKSPPPPDSACRSDRVEGYLMWRRDGRLPDRPWDRPGTDPGTPSGETSTAARGVQRSPPSDTGPRLRAPMRDASRASSAVQASASPGLHSPGVRPIQAAAMRLRQDGPLPTRARGMREAAGERSDHLHEPPG